LAVLVRVAELRSFSAAARELGIAKSAVSRRINDLETRLGVRLLTRSTRNIGLTTDGLQVFEHARNLVTEARAALDVVAGSGTKPRGLLRVNAPGIFSEQYLTPAIGAFLEHQAEVEVQLTVDDRLIDVVEGGWDVVIRISRSHDDSSLVVRKLAEDRGVIVASPAYLDRRGRPEEVCHLVTHDCLHYGLLPLEVEWGFKLPRRRVSVPLRVRFTANDGANIRQAALAGIGLATLPWFMVAEDVRAGRLELVLDGIRHAPLTVAAVMPQRDGMPARTRAFVDHLVKWFATPPWKVPALTLARAAG
ncbi:MAG: LysR family transcriptional regulator, partial [Myxococcota bacterium]